MNRRPRFSMLLLFATLVTLSASVSAQVTNVAIHGTVSDPTGAVVPNAQVTAVNTETNFLRSVLTDLSGGYAIQFLPLGPYRLEVAASGFKKFVQNGIILEVNRNARVDPTLETGAVSETVVVTSEGSLVETTNATLGQTTTNEEITRLPLVDRDVYRLLELTAGVDSTSNNNIFGAPAQITTVNGSANSGGGTVNYYLDGGSNTNGLRNTGNSLPNPDAVQEFRVITNSYSAEYGRFAGGVVDLVTKSGTNQWHGSAFEFIRNDALNATRWTPGISVLKKMCFAATSSGAASAARFCTTRRSSLSVIRGCGSACQSSPTPRRRRQRPSATESFPGEFATRRSQAIAQPRTSRPVSRTTRFLLTVLTRRQNEFSNNSYRCPTCPTVRSRRRRRVHLIRTKFSSSWITLSAASTSWRAVTSSRPAQISSRCSATCHGSNAPLPGGSTTSTSAIPGRSARQ